MVVQLASIDRAKIKPRIDLGMFFFPSMVVTVPCKGVKVKALKKAKLIQERQL